MKHNVAKSTKIESIKNECSNKECLKKEQIKKTLAKKHACYVLITCDLPTDGGEMQVDMSYEGDAMLASYLLEGAQVIMNQSE